VPPTTPRPPTGTSNTKPTTKALGQQAEDWALAHLQQAGMQLVQRNYRTPGRGGGEIDLIVRDPQGTLVFVEVRRRNTRQFGGGAASVTWAKQKRLIFAARFYLKRLTHLPACRFDVVEVGPEQTLNWLQGAFEGG